MSAADESASIEPRPVGILGLGPMGLAIAQRLIESGTRVETYDPAPLLREQFAANEHGATLAPSLFDLGDACRIIVSTLTAADLKDALVGDGDRPGVATAFASDGIVIHLGGGPYDVVVKIAGMLGGRAIGFVDVFTCSTLSAVTDGRMELLAGGYPDFVEKARRVLAPLGTMERIGGTGTAVGLAALRGYVRAARLIALSEAMLIGSHAGISRDVLASVFDGNVASGPLSRRLAGLAQSQLRPAPLLRDTLDAVDDALEFGERIGLSGDGVAFARDLLLDAIDTTGEAADESALLCHLSEVAADAN